MPVRCVWIPREATKEQKFDQELVKVMSACLTIRGYS